ncbi:hypothetical protein RHMOL_Rhmol01G0181900 [Rhododendron molle]|uniref:Uncharacterized protein n=1 Tax=Rhododendron molle TaxID=49168 RepID=A0ACC0Q5H4_RHOML|nr:hypothetical protein RHMOL_Rhmol01G0181900 [Rhododendron molle]
MRINCMAMPHLGGVYSTKKGKGSLNAYRLYLDKLRASQIEWDPWRTSGPEPEYLARSRAVRASRVPVEWVNESVRRMLALENVVRRAAYSFPLELCYPAPIAQPAQAAASRRTQPAEEEEEEGEEEEGEEEEARSGSDDTADDPNYLQDPTENFVDDDGGGDNDDDDSDTDWFGR